MSDADWTELTDGLAISNVDRGVTAGITPPNGGGSFIHGFNSLVVVNGAVGFFTNQANFAPMAKGVSVRGAVSRGVSGGNTGFSIALFAGFGGTSVNDEGYILGLADGDPYHVVLKKGTLATALSDLAPDPSVNGILLRSTATDSIGSSTPWRHLRLDMIANLNGDVVLQCFENDLAANPLSGAPVWVAIPGMEEFIDDTLQINSGSAPFTSGRGGFAYHATDVTRRGFVDHVEIFRQL